MNLELAYGKVFDIKSKKGVVLLGRFLNETIPIRKRGQIFYLTWRQKVIYNSINKIAYN